MSKPARLIVWKQNRNNAKNILNSLEAVIHNKPNAAGNSEKVVHHNANRCFKSPSNDNYNLCKKYTNTSSKRRNEVRLRPGQEVGAPMFEPEVFRKQMYCIEESFVALLVLFGAPIVIRGPGNCASLAPFVTPLTSSIP